MNNYSKITNPLTNETFNIFSTEGKFLLKNYIDISIPIRQSTKIKLSINQI